MKGGGESDTGSEAADISEIDVAEVTLELRLPPNARRDVAKCVSFWRVKVWDTHQRHHASEVGRDCLFPSLGEHHVCNILANSELTKTVA